MANTPQFAATPACESAQVLTAETGTRLVPTNAVTIFTAGASGSRIDELNISGLGTTVANVIHLYLYNGTTYYLLKDIATVATTASATAPSYQNTLTFSNLVIPTGYSLRATVGTTETIGYMLTFFGGDF